MVLREIPICIAPESELMLMTAGVPSEKGWSVISDRVFTLVASVRPSRGGEETSIINPPMATGSFCFLNESEFIAAFEELACRGLRSLRSHRAGIRQRS
jgi:hypothetical protein